MTVRQNIANRFGISPAYRVMYMVAGMFIIASLLLGGVFHFYDRFWWWDDMLHGLSGVMFVLIGLALAEAGYAQRRTRTWFVILFAFCLALAIGVIWEIIEFSSDTFFHTALQQWDMPPQAIVMGKSYQGMGLRDTMSDLINATIGATVTVIIASIMRHRSMGDR